MKRISACCYKDRYPQCESEKSIYRPSILCTRYGDVVDFSLDGLLSQKPIELEQRRRMRDADALHSPIRDYWGRKRSPPSGFKESVRKLTRILFICFFLLLAAHAKEVVGTTALDRFKRRELRLPLKDGICEAATPVIYRGRYQRKDLQGQLHLGDNSLKI
ncbi:hypothetical protein TNCV_796531 [Trichonephila clavipes]|uniref:Uncharacterized protein n=1 Tax=Trichonephila clavipes TaxID=2585209 RepID=A0A8X7BM02_TRICX|nr:hypothetical protein TNCV_796531 [Trichonephila clavipes]